MQWRYIDVLAKKLRQRRIPAALVAWIVDFCQQRQASLVINGHTTETADLPQARLPQGSPLSPILFLHFNADLVSSKIDRNKGAIAFVDDYTPWVTGSSAQGNAKLLQETIVAMAERWVISNGAGSEADKTAFIHFTKAGAKWSEEALVVKGKEMRPQNEVKILGVVLDHGPRFQQHMVRQDDDASDDDARTRREDCRPSYRRSVPDRITDQSGEGSRHRIIAKTPPDTGTHVLGEVPHPPLETSLVEGAQ